MKTITVKLLAVCMAVAICLAPVAWAAEKSDNENPRSEEHTSELQSQR